LFEDVGTSLSNRPEPGDKTGIGRGLRAVLGEIDEISLATLKSISLTTLVALSSRSGKPSE